MSTAGVSRSLAGVSRGTAANVELQNRQRYLARRTMARRPSRIQPMIIIVLVLSLGLFFIGLIMTIIANWPGYSTVGNDPLEVAGPTLLVFGIIVFIIGIFCVCYRNSANKHKWERAISERTMSRSTLGGLSTISGPGLARTPSIDAKPGKGILKKTSSTSTSGTGREFAEGDSGVAATTNASYERDSDSSLGSAGRFEGYRIESLPDPMGRGGMRNGGGPIEHSSDTEQPAIIPQPVRQITRPHMDKHARSRAESAAMQAAANPAYSPPRGDWQEPAAGQHPGQQRSMKNYSNEGYDMYDPNVAQQQQQQRPLSGTQNRAYADDSQQVAPRQQKQEPQYAQIQRNQQRQPQYQQQPQYQPLHINIKAQPGTSVHITPGAHPTSAMPPKERSTSVETEI
ncbi:hypothetical protein NP493_254g00003 [Ridgeia piscesae]|uniref:Uncharacterized protein n=1 Tax=Ridgeia piscesae TaxID=27915 RepID=A0AAD9UCT3_RIDPI|nr:hypothetical protein NP493_254g00003 [Ridgeia piscesae]